MAKSIKDIQSDCVRLHEEILQIAEEHSDIIASADENKQRWHDVFPDGMLLELCREFECCPALVFIALELCGKASWEDVRKISIECIDITEQTKQIFDSISQTAKTIKYDPRKVSYAAFNNKRLGKYQLKIQNYAIYTINRIVLYLLLSCGVYRISDDVTGKNYIGQTIVSFRKRWGQHRRKYRQSNTLLYEHMCTIGIAHVTFSIVQILIEPTVEKLLQAECYWIRKYHSYDFHGGLNDSRPKSTHRLDDDTIKRIYQLLLDGVSNEKTARITSVSSATISDIRNGKRHRRAGITYPIPIRNSNISAEMQERIANMLIDDLSISCIVEQTGVSRQKVRAINQGKYRHIRHLLGDEAFPLKQLVPQYLQNRESVSDMEIKVSVNSTSVKTNDNCLLSIGGVILSRKVFKSLLMNNTFPVLGKRFNVSDVSVRKAAKRYYLPYRERERKSFSEQEWENEVWNSDDYAYNYQGEDNDNILLSYLRTRSKKFTIIYCQTSNAIIDYCVTQSALSGKHHAIEYSPSCLYLEEDDLYFRTSADAVRYLDEHYGISASHQTIERKMESGKVYGFTFVHVPEDEFYEVIQHHHVVSYAFDPKWASIVEDPSVLPDFVSLDELPWVEEFKAFYGMD